MFVDFNKYVKYLGDKKMSPNQFAFCWMVYHRDIDNIKRYQSRVGPFIKEDIDDLINRGFILYAGNPDIYQTGQMVVTQLFSDEILIEDEGAALNELIEVYPPFFYLNNTKISTTACDLDSLADLYANKILKGDKIKHRMIVEKTKEVAAMMQAGVVSWMKIDKYVRGRQWSIADARDSGAGDLTWNL